jgi:hypothetical protein
MSILTAVAVRIALTGLVLLLGAVAVTKYADYKSDDIPEWMKLIGGLGIMFGFPFMYCGTLTAIWLW